MVLASRPTHCQGIYTWKVILMKKARGILAQGHLEVTMEPETKGDNQGLARQEIAVFRARGLATKGGALPDRDRREPVEGLLRGALRLRVVVMVEMAEVVTTAISAQSRRTVTTLKTRGERSAVLVGLENGNCSWRAGCVPWKSSFGMDVAATGSSPRLHRTRADQMSG